MWGAVSRGLAPLDRLAEALRLRRPDVRSPLPAGPVPPEIKPVRRALDTLFKRLEKSRKTEWDFTAFAADEFKTPLPVSGSRRRSGGWPMTHRRARRLCAKSKLPSSAPTGWSGSFWN